MEDTKEDSVEETDMEDTWEMSPSDDVLFVEAGNFSLSTGIIRKVLARHLGGNWPRFTVATFASQWQRNEDERPFWGGQDEWEDSTEQEDQKENIKFLSKIGCDILFNFQLSCDVRLVNRYFTKVIFTFSNQAENRVEDLLWDSRALLGQGGQLIMVGTHAAMPGTGRNMFSHVKCQEKEEEEKYMEI